MVITDCITLIDIANHAENPAVALREGRLQFATQSGSTPTAASRIDAREQIDKLLTLLR